MEPVNPDLAGGDRLYPGEKPGDPPTLATRETLIRWLSIRCATAGLVLIAATVTAAGYATAVIDHDGLTGVPTSVVIFLVTVLAATLTLGGGLLTLAGVEMLTRYGRTLSRRAVQATNEAARNQQETAVLLAALDTAVRCLADKHTAMEQTLGEVRQTLDKVPGYAEGVIDGVAASARQPLPAPISAS